MRRSRSGIWLVAGLIIASALVVVWRLGFEPDREPQRAENPEAHNSYMQATRLASAGDSTSIAKSVEFYEAAVKSDPDYALAWAGLAHTWTRLSMLAEVRPTEALPKAAEAARRAIEIGEHLPQSQHAAGRVLVLYERDWAGAEKAFVRALELDPKLVECRYDYARLILTPTLRFTDAIDQLKSAAALDPSNHAVAHELANTYILAGRLEDGSPSMEAARRLAPDSPSTLVTLGLAAAAQGKLEKALARFEEAARRGRLPWVLGHLGYTLARLGRKEEAARIVAELERIPAGKDPPDYELGVIHTGLGMRDQAFAELERAAGLYSAETLRIKVDPRLEELRRHSRFRVLLRDMRLE